MYQWQVINFSNTLRQISPVPRPVGSKEEQRKESIVRSWGSCGPREKKIRVRKSTWKLFNNSPGLSFISFMFKFMRGFGFKIPANKRRCRGWKFVTVLPHSPWNSVTLTGWRNGGSRWDEVYSNVGQGSCEHRGKDTARMYLGCAGKTVENFSTVLTWPRPTRCSRSAFMREGMLTCKCHPKRMEKHDR